MKKPRRHKPLGWKMEQITSRQNKIISHFRALGRERAYREERREYVCDGEKLLAEALRWGAEITAVLVSRELSLALPCRTACYGVSQELLDYASPLKNCPGVLFSVRMKKPASTAPKTVLVLETIQDPGNLGTIIRTANALRMDTVVLCGNCADLYNPKTTRAAMGAIFRQQVLPVPLCELSETLGAWGLRLYGAALSENASDIRDLELANVAIAIGSEGQGLSLELRELCDGELIIPMNEACESLNAACAAAIVMWEIVGRRA